MNNEITQLSSELEAAKRKLLVCEENYLKAKRERDETLEIVGGYEQFLELRRKLFPTNVPGPAAPSDEINEFLLADRHVPSHRNGIPYKAEFTSWSMAVKEPLTVPFFRAYLEAKYPNSEVNPQSVRNPFREALDEDWIFEVKKGSGRSAAIYAVNPKHT